MWKEIEMIIVSQDKKCILNFENIFGLFTKEKIVYASMSDDLSVAIGSYDTEKRTLEIFNDISKCYDQEHIRVLIMPEK